MNRRLDLLICLAIATLIIIIGMALSGTAREDKATACIYCHQTLNVAFEDEDTKCSGCHTVTRDSPAYHNSNICDNCHKIIDTTSYHQLHSSTQCSTCHGTNGQGKPSQSITDCVGCHGSEVHTIHTNCMTCHGTSVENKQAPVKTPVVKTDYSKYTLYSLLTELYNILM